MKIIKQTRRVINYVWRWIQSFLNRFLMFMFALLSTRGDTGLEWFLENLRFGSPVVSLFLVSLLSLFFISPSNLDNKQETSKKLRVSLSLLNSVVILLLALYYLYTQFLRYTELFFISLFFVGAWLSISILLSGKFLKVTSLGENLAATLTLSYGFIAGLLFNWTLPSWPVLFLVFGFLIAHFQLMNFLSPGTSVIESRRWNYILLVLAVLPVLFRPAMIVYWLLLLYFIFALKHTSSQEKRNERWFHRLIMSYLVGLLFFSL